MGKVRNAVRVSNAEANSQTVKKPSRKKLTLAQKVDVIRLYELHESLRRIAAVFGCGRTQIKSILRNRNHHLAEWEKANQDEPLHVKRPLPDPVARVLFEWVKRAKCYHINITDDILCSFGREIAIHMGMRNFELNEICLDSFKQKCDSEDSGIKQERDMSPEDRKPLSIGVIIEDLRREDNESTAKFRLGNEGDQSFWDGTYMEPHGVSNTIIAGSFISEVSSPDAEASFPHEEVGIADPADNDKLSEEGFAEVPGSTLDEVKEITSYREAFNHLGPLEQFVLLRGNIRAVGLINQLENLFRDEIEKLETD